MPPTVSWPTRSPASVMTNGIARPARASRGSARTMCPKRRRLVGARRPATWRPRAAATSALRGAGRAPRDPVAQPDRPQARRRPRAARPASPRQRRLLLSGRPRAIWLDRVAEHRPEHGEPVPHPAGRAGQVDDQRAPGTPGDAAGQRRGRDAVRDAVRPDRLGDAGHLAVEHPPGHLRGEVGRATARCRRWSAPRRSPAATAARSAASTGSPSGTTTGPSTSKPSAAQPVDEQRPGPVRRRPRPPRGWSTVTTRARIRSPRDCAGAVQSAGLAAGLLLDPDVGDDGGRVDRLDHVDQGEAGDRDAGQRLHLDAGAVGGPHRRA